MNYKTPNHIKPSDYPDSDVWVANRFLYVEKIRKENPVLFDKRYLWHEVLWIEIHRFEAYQMAWDVMFQNIRIYERDEDIPYLEVIG